MRRHRHRRPRSKVCALVELQQDANPSYSDELRYVAEACARSQLWKAKLKDLKLPDGFEAIIEPWPYGAPEVEDGDRRLFQGLVFARDTRSQNRDSNFYAYPLPLIPVMDAVTKEIVRVDELATGGNKDKFEGKTHLPEVIEHCQSSEYVPELLPGGTRKDLKPLSVLQPNGASFTVSEGNLIEWQKWRMRVTFNSREGAVIHDIRYQGRSVLYRLSFSEMVRCFLPRIDVKRSYLLIHRTDSAVCRPKTSVPQEASIRLWRWWSGPYCE